MLQKLRNRESQVAVWLTALVMLCVFLGGQRWKKGKVIDADVVSYYSYLPATFIYGDVSMKYAQHDPWFGDKVWGVYWQEGQGPTQKYTMGMSVMYAPFFFAGHLSAKLGFSEADGYSSAYAFWLQFSSIFYLVLGLWLLRKVLRRFYSERVTALVLLLLAFGTNTFYYAVGQAGMPHVYLFALLSATMLLSIRFYAAPSWREAILLGLCCGLMTLVRPNHLLLWAVPVLYGVTDRESLRLRWKFIRKHLPKFLIWPVILFLIFLPQLLYWKYMTTHWLHYSYGDEGFFWTDPKVLSVLFSFRNGWLIYTPLMALALVGMGFIRRYARGFSFLVPFVFGLSLYVISSWWCWWYGGCFGNRVFIDLYPLLAIGLGAILTWMAAKMREKSLRIAGLAIAALFVLLNLFQSVQYTRGLIHHDSMTFSSYVSVLGKWEKPEDFEEKLDAPDYAAALKGAR